MDSQKKDIEILPKINHISLSKEYYSTRMALTQSMNLFLLYDSNDNEAKEYWEDFGNDLLAKFPQYLSISLVSSITAEKSLIDCFKDGKDSDKDIIDYPGIILAHPHLTDPQISLGVNPLNIYSLIEKYDSFYRNDFETEKNEQFAKIKAILDSFPVICFIKGTPQDPYCKFSRKFIEIINKCQIRYKAIDIFKDEKLRCYLRLYANWKTFPQLYINGKIIGGVDKLRELVDKGEFIGMVPNEVKIDSIVEKVKQIVNKKPMVIFVEGDNHQNIINIAKEHKLNYDVFDIKKDMMLENILRKDYGVISFPSVFIGGKYIESGDVISNLFC